MPRFRVIQFLNDDKSYKSFRQDNPAAYVVNTYGRPSRDYLVLHTASCATLQWPEDKGLVLTAYRKICSESREDLENWAETDVDGCLSPCGICMK